MANENRISVVITADPTGAVTGIRMVGDETEKLGGRTQSLTQRLKSHWAEVSVGIYAAVRAFQSIWGLMEKAAQTDEAMASLDALTRQYGMTAQDLVGRIEQESKGLIGMGAAAKVAGDALMKGLGPEQLAQIASWSVSLSHIKAGTVSTADAFEMLSQSIATGRERGLKALVGIVDLEQKYGKYADTMSKAEKAQAMYTIVAERMAQVQATLGPDLDSAADRMERFNNSVERMKYFVGSLLLIIGQPFMAIFQVAMTLVYGLAGAFDTLVSEGARVTDWLGVTEGATERWAKKADTAYGNAAQSAVDALANIKGALASLGDMGKVGGGVPLPALGGDGNRKQLDQLTELYRKYIEEKDLASCGRIRPGVYQAEQVVRRREEETGRPSRRKDPLRRHVRRLLGEVGRGGNRPDLKNIRHRIEDARGDAEKETRIHAGDREGIPRCRGTAHPGRAGVKRPGC